MMEGPASRVTEKNVFSPFRSMVDHTAHVQQLHTLEITIAQLGVPPLLIAMALGMTLPLPVIRTHGVTATKTQLKEADLAAELALESLAYFLSNI